MSLVRPGMDRNPVSTGFDNGFGRFQHIGYADITLVSQQSYLIQVDTEFGHFLHLHRTSAII
jgi:hypothetical protein